MMKQTILIALGLAFLPLGGMAQADTATLLDWQQAKAPVVLVEEIIDPALNCRTTAGKPQLAVRVLASAHTIVKEGTMLLLDAGNTTPATQGAARRWILNLAALKNLRPLHARGEVLHATAPTHALKAPEGTRGFTEFRQKMAWNSILAYLRTDISPEEVRRMPIVCREQFKATTTHYEKDGQWHEEQMLVCDMALPEAWCKGYLPGERIIIHAPEGADITDFPQTLSGDFLLTDRFERQGNTLHLYWESCRRVSGHAGNTEKIADILNKPTQQPVQLKADESSPYLPKEQPQEIDYPCHRLYRWINQHDTVVRCKELRCQIGNYEGNAAKLYKWSYITVVVEECLKGTMRPGTKLTFVKQLEGSKKAAGVYEVNDGVYIGFNRHEGKWNPVEQAVNLGLHDWQFMLAPTSYYEEAMQKVLTEHPEIFGKPGSTPAKPQIGTQEAREMALQAIREHQGNTDIPYNVQGYGNYLLIYPAPSHQGKGPHVLIRKDGSIVRIFHPHVPPRSINSH